jgi:hypothetical protein
MVDVAQSPYPTILKSGFATQHRFTWPFLADWVLKKYVNKFTRRGEARGRLQRSTHPTFGATARPPGL